VVGLLAESMLSFRGELLRAMVAEGHEVLAIAPEDDAHVRAELAAIGVTYDTVPLRRAGMSPWRDLRAATSLTRTLRDFRPAAVLAYGAKPVVYGSLAARLAGARTRAAMITGAGSALSGAGPRGRILATVLRTLYRIGLAQTHVVIFQNADDRSLFKAHRLIGRHQRVVLVNGSGVDLSRFSVAPLPPPPMTFVMVGRLIRDKGLYEYVEAAREVRRSHPEVRAQLLGGLDANPSGISQAELDRWRAEGVIEYLGSVKDVRPHVAGAHVCVLPSYGEGMPRSVLEAMAMGRAVITTDVPGCRETVEEGRNGMLVPPRDPRALAAAMRLMVADPARVAQMGLESRAMAEERFDVHAVNGAILAAMHLA
jgi:glycosyltransferase involved in cell wall biosynthesis